MDQRQRQPEPKGKITTAIIKKEEQLTVFHLDDDQLAFPVSVTWEILKPQGMVGMPGGPDYLVGMLRIRGTMLPVIDMRQLVGKEPLYTWAFKETPQRILVVDTGATVVGLLVDGVHDVVRVPGEAVRPCTPDETIYGDAIRGIVSLENDNRKILVTDPTRLPVLTNTEAVGNTESTYRKSITEESIHKEKMVKFLLFNVQTACKTTFAVPLESVREVVRSKQVTPVPKAPPFIMGVTNLHGAIVPVLDAGIRFRLTPEEAAAAARGEMKIINTLLVVSVNTTPVGIAIDAIPVVKRIPVSHIRTEYDFIPEGIRPFAAGAVTDEQQGQRTWLLAPNQLLEGDGACGTLKKRAFTEGSQTRATEEDQ